jgi:hypothetical protein
VLEIPSSSYGLSLFSLKAGSHHNEGAGAAPGGSSSVSIGELWSGVDQLDEAGHTSHPRVNFGGSKRTGEGRSQAAKGASVNEALGSSSTPPRGCGGSSTKNKATLILSNAVGPILPLMR